MPTTAPVNGTDWRQKKRVEPSGRKAKPLTFVLNDRKVPSGASLIERKISAHERSQIWHATLGTHRALATPDEKEADRRAALVRSAAAASEFLRRRLTVTSRAYAFVFATSKAYEMGNAAEALQAALTTILQLVQEREFSVLDSVFENLIDRVTEAAGKDLGNDTFPREGSFWIACLTLTKGVRKHLYQRVVFINYLRDYAESILEHNVAERLLRNVD